MVEKIRLVSDILANGGIRTHRGYPSEKYFRPESPVAAVNLHSAQGETVVVVAEIFALTANGCENTANQAVELLKEEGFSCQAQGCAFRADMGLFSLRVLATWIPGPAEAASLPYTIYLDDTALLYVTGFTAKSSAELYEYVFDSGATEILRQNMEWTLTLEELIPPSVSPQLDSPDAFTLHIQRKGGRESYPGCLWETVQRTETEQGVRLVRIAKSKKDRQIS